ncbi:hypothetical protein M2351_007230 [Azospirillum canadense]|nr:hypothetical protein [Azospirillum canadense]
MALGALLGSERHHFIRLEEWSGIPLGLELR